MSVYGTYSTDAATAAKVVTLVGNSGWKPFVGSFVTVKFTYTNSVANATLNVNGSGAYSIWYNNTEYTSDSSYAGYENRCNTYMFNGTHYVFISWSYDANTNTQVRVYRQDGSYYNKDYPLIASKTVPC